MPLLLGDAVRKLNFISFKRLRETSTGGLRVPEVRFSQPFAATNKNSS